MSDSENIYNLLHVKKYDPFSTKRSAFILYPHQVIPKYYLLSSDVRNLILHYSLGSGKTSAAVFALLHNLHIYRMFKFDLEYATNKGFLERNIVNRPIYVIGAWQTQAQVINELLRPQFGMISAEQLKEIDALISSPIKENKQRGLLLKQKFVTEFTKDIKFMGYQKFFDEIFGADKLNQQLIQNCDALINMYNNGQLKPRDDFLRNIQGAIIIVDEMQHLYSNNGLNSYGFALAIVSRLAEEYDIKIMYLSGTMLNSSLAEVVDVMSILTKDFKKREDYTYQDETEDGFSITKLRKDKIEEIQNIFYPSFMYYNQSERAPSESPQLISINKLPSDIYVYTTDGELDMYNKLLPYGEKPKKSIDTISTGKFKAMVFPKKPMLPTEIHIGNHLIEDPESGVPMIVYSVCTQGEQAEAYEQYVRRNINITEPDADEGKAAQTIAIQDGCVEAKTKGININRLSSGIYTGNFMDADKLGNYCALGKELFYLCLSNIMHREKTVVYHNKLNSFGINQYQRILVHNGFCFYNTSPIPKSLCIHCGKTMADHNLDLDQRLKHHVCNHFDPIFIDSLHGDKSPLERDKTTKIYNSSTNLYGNEIAVLFVSDVAYSGVSFFNTNNLVILSRVSNISKWKQIYARIIRTKSHQGLPENKQYAKIYTMVIEFPDELKVIPQLKKYTYADRYYKIRANLNMSIEDFIKSLSKKCIGEVLFNHPEDYKQTPEEIFKTKELFKIDVEKEMYFVVGRCFHYSQSCIWNLDTFVKRLKDPELSLTFLNLSKNSDEDIKSILFNLKRTEIFSYDRYPDKYMIQSKWNFNKHVGTDPKISFSVFQQNIFKQSNIESMIQSLSMNIALSSKLSTISKILKLCHHKYELLKDKDEFWNVMYEIGNEYYSNDDEQFIHNHISANRMRSRMIGCYYGNEIILMDGTTKNINYSFPIIQPLKGLPYYFNILSTALSDSSPFYIHVSVVKVFNENETDRRKKNKGVACNSMNVEQLYPYFKNLVTKDIKKKDFCRNLLHELCRMQEEIKDAKFVLTPFEMQ